MTCIMRCILALAFATIGVLITAAQEAKPPASVAGSGGPTAKVAPAEDGATAAVEAGRTVQGIAGSWVGSPELQKTFDEMSPNPDYLGRIDTFDVHLMDAKAFWADNELQSTATALQKLASQRGHTIMATGGFGGEGERQPMFGYFMLTHARGKTFVCPLDLDRVNFRAWPMHFIRGKYREEDLLIIEFDDPGRRQIVALRRAESDAGG